MQPDQPYSGVENLEIMREAENYNRYLLDTVRRYAPARGRVLDFGAGSGQFAIPLSQLGFDVTAIEPDDFLRSMILHKGVRAAASPDELPDHSFEYVYTLNVLEHIQDDVKTLRHLHSKLSSKRGSVDLRSRVSAFPVLYTGMDAKVGHVRRYTRKTLTTAVTSAGFRIEDVAYVDPLGFFAALLFKLAGNKDGSVNPRALRLYDRLAFPLSRAVDTLTYRWFGKNLLLACKSSSYQRSTF